jgi:capsular polysaccharide biosynthesis protein
MKRFIHKAWGKVLFILRHYIYYNYKFKPDQAVLSAHEFYMDAGEKEGITYSEIYPADTSTLDIDEEMYKMYSPYPKHAYKVDVPPSFILTVEDGKVYQDIDFYAIISKSNTLIGDVSFQYSRKKWEMVSPFESDVFKLKYFFKPLVLEGCAFSLLSGGGVSIGNYFHWLIDSLARIKLLKEANLFDEVDWFLVHNLRPSFMEQSLSILGIPESKLIEVDLIRHVKADKLIVTSPVRGNDKHVPTWVVDFFREDYLPAVTKKYDYRRIYISRQDANARKVVNETALIELLLEYGFEIIELSKYGFEEKIDLFSGADVIISPIGASLTNLVFCKKGSSVIELFPQGFILPDFVDIAKKVGMHYHYLICKNENPSRDIADGRKEDLNVDLVEIRKLLDQQVLKKKD